MKNPLMGWIFGVVVFACSNVALAQTPAGPEPKAAGAKTTDAISRTADGQPNLSGVWVGGGGPEFRIGGAKAPMQLTRWGMDKFTWNKEPSAPDSGGPSRTELDPVYHCYPAGMVRLGPPLQVPGGFTNAFQIIQIPGQVLVLYNFEHEVRRIYMDGRQHPKPLALTWNGHSIGKWDGDTLVVDTVGLRDETWLDSLGHEHSDQLHVVERYRRVDPDHLELERTLTDPVALAEPHQARAIFEMAKEVYDMDENVDGRQNDCSGYMLRESFFGKTDLLRIGDHP